ncbi:hypothetical protein NDU88_003273 [Pleurodeles waltl]|uniref:Uncharacterized protein n=1 Tax=Pleurodeles waltl TaxID=8319 RepID=A0AAV7VDQ4_PLEWA|nr:hypothetical protein NDU88_003273 [Pleurodeles waltl]
MAEDKVRQALLLLEEARKSAGGVAATVWACSPPRQEKVRMVQEEAGTSGDYPGRQFAASRRWAEDKASPRAGNWMMSQEDRSLENTVKDTLRGRWNYRGGAPIGAAFLGEQRLGAAAGSSARRAVHPKRYEVGYTGLRERRWADNLRSVRCR